MTRSHRPVWNHVKGMLVPAAESARGKREGSRPSLAAAAGLLLGIGGLQPAHAAPLVDFSGGLASWTTAGSVTLSSTTVALNLGGNSFSLSPAAGESMAEITPSGAPSSVDALLGLSANSIESLLNNSNGQVTDFGVLTKTVALNAGTYTFAWAYAAEDYQPFNDGVLFSLVGNGTQSVTSLARNGSSPSDTSGPSPGTLILGSYGSTAWETASFTITTAGSYQLGFASYNWNDTALDPHLFVTGDTGTYTGTPVSTSGGAPTTFTTSGGNVSASVFDTSSAAYAQTSLTFDGGTLQYGADTTTSKSAMLDSTGGTLDTGGNTVSYAGVISGSGALTKSGAGTLQLSAANDYTGVTHIAVGALSLMGSGSIADSSTVVDDAMLDISGTTSGTAIRSLAGGGTVALGAATLTLTHGADTFGGALGGTGGVSLSAGTETLTGVSTYTGATQIAQGATLALSGTGSIAGSRVVEDNGTLDLTAATVLTTLPSLAGNGVATLGAKGLALSQAAGSFSGAIGGTGGLAITGGTETLSGTNTYGGGTYIGGGANVILASKTALGGGTLALAGVLETAVDVNVSNPVQVAGGATVRTDVGTTTTLSGSVASAGSGSCFIKTGSGALAIDGTAILNDGTCVEQGRLSANGLLVSAVSVSPGALLRGVGTISGPVTVQGVLAPGHSPGTLTVAGTVTMKAGSSYQEDINGTGVGSGPGNYSRLLITGAQHQFLAGGATLAPNLASITGTAAYTPYVPALGDTFRIITAQGGIVGQFGAVTQPQGLANGTRLAIFYDIADSNSIDLRVIPVSYAAYFQSIGMSGNTRAAAAALDRLVAADVAGTASSRQDALLYDIGSLKAQQLETLGPNLSGEVHADLAAVAPLEGQWLQSTVARELEMQGGADAARRNPGNALWLDAGANHGDWHADAVSSGFTANRTQVAVGWDALSTPSARAGVGFSHSLATVAAGAASGAIEQALVFAYGQRAFHRAILDGMAGYGSATWSSLRADPLGLTGALDTVAHGRTALASAGMRLPWRLRGIVLAPYARVLWERLTREAFDEAASNPAALDAVSGPGYCASGTRVTAGLSGGSAGQDPLAARLTYEFDVGMARDSAALRSPTIRASLGGQSFDIATPAVGHLAGLARIGGTLRLTRRAYGYLGVSGETRTGTSADYGVELGVRALF
jgi:fibronectin-binding autotransporter adhesin